MMMMMMMSVQIFFPVSHLKLGRETWQMLGLANIGNIHQDQMERRWNAIMNKRWGKKKKTSDSCQQGVKYTLLCATPQSNCVFLSTFKCDCHRRGISRKEETDRKWHTGQSFSISLPISCVITAAFDGLLTAGTFLCLSAVSHEMVSHTLYTHTHTAYAEQVSILPSTLGVPTPGGGQWASANVAERKRKKPTWPLGLTT